MRNIEVCVSPDLVEVYGVKDKVVVVIDILRATSCMTTAIAHGVKSLIPVASLAECKALQNQGYIAAAERDGKKEEGFDIGNSPFSYMEKEVIGKTVAVTTTNGTQAISKSLAAKEIIIGSFLNRSAVVNYLKSQSNDVLLLCAGWKGKANLEDTMFAGAIINDLENEFDTENDSAISAKTLYLAAKSNMEKFLSNSSHVKRLKGLDIRKDITFCLTSDVYSVIPVLRGRELVNMAEELIEQPQIKSVK